MPMSPPKSGIKNRFYHTLIEQKSSTICSVLHTLTLLIMPMTEGCELFSLDELSQSQVFEPRSSWPRSKVDWDFLNNQSWGWFSKRETFLPRPSLGLPTTFRRFLRARRRSASTRTSRNIESRIWTQGSTARRRTGRTARWRRAGRWGRLKEGRRWC